jgi:hypothetical protein
MEVIIMLSAGAALEKIQDVVARAGSSLAPLHSGTDNPELKRYFFVRAKDFQQAEELAGTLRSLNGVEAAYVKPLGEPPSM